MRRCNQRNAFTLVELLVVLAIIGILMSLALTAIGPVLENARRNACRHHMEQIATAAVNYELSHDRLPGYVERFGDFLGGRDPSDPGSYAGNVPAHVKAGPWTVALLEKLDRQPLYEFWTEGQYPLLSDGAGDRRATSEGYSTVAAANVGEYQCPSATGSLDRFGRNNYIANTGLHSDIYPLTYTRPGESLKTVSFAQAIGRHNAVFTNRYKGFDPADPASLIATGKDVRMEDFKDGRSYTMLISESNQAAPWHVTRLTKNTMHLTNFTVVRGERLTAYWPESRYLQGAVWHFEDSMGYAGAAPVARVHKINGGDIQHVRMSLANMSDIARPSSNHPGGVNVGFADGRVIFVTESINYRIYQAMMTPDTRASDMPFNYVMVSEESL